MYKQATTQIGSEGGLIEGNPRTSLEMKMPQITDKAIPVTEYRKPSLYHQIMAAKIFAARVVYSDRPKNKKIGDNGGAKNPPGGSRFFSEMRNNFNDYEGLQTSHEPIIDLSKPSSILTISPVALSNLFLSPFHRRNANIPVFWEIRQNSKSPEYNAEKFSSILNDALNILKTQGIVFIGHYLPPIIVCDNRESFNFFRNKPAPEWVEAFTANTSEIVLMENFIRSDNVPLRREASVEELAHELLHGMHNAALVAAYPDATREEINKFKDEYLKGSTHIGFIEGVVEAIAKPFDIKSFLNEARNTGFYPLFSLKNSMPDLARGPLAIFTGSYPSAQMYGEVFINYVDQNKPFVVENMKKAGINVNEKMSAQNLLLEFIKDYLISMFVLFKNGEQPKKIEEHFSKVIGIDFGFMEEYANRYVIEQAELWGFEPSEINVRYQLIELKDKNETRLQ